MTINLTIAPSLNIGDKIGIAWLGDEPSWYRVVKVDGTTVELEPVR